MWHKYMFTVFLLVGAISSESPTKNIFTAVSPKIVKENSKYVVNIAVDQKSPSAIQFTVSVNSSKTEISDDILYSAAPVDIQPGESADIEVDVKALPVLVYNLTIIGKYSDGSGEFHDSANIYRNSKTQSLLIQTDKAIYKPGETVKFRVVMLCSRLRPLDNQIVNLTITDPQRNVIKVFNNEQVSKGIFSSSIPISAEPNLGEWKIRAVSNGQTEQLQFTVDQYVLPKFKVEVKIPTFVTYNSSKFTAEVKTAYTYGKPLKGDVEVRLQEYYRYSWGAQPQKIVSKKGPIDGSVFFEFDIAQELGQGPLTYDKQFQVLATVTDALTGRQQNGTSIIRVTQYPYKIDMIETPRNYKPGFPLTLKFKVSTQDDIPISDSNPEALKIEHGFACNAEEGILYRSVPVNGIVNVTFQTPTNEFVSANSLKVTYKDLVYNGYPPQKSITPSKAYMQIEIQNATRTPEVGSTVEVQAIFNKPIDSINILLFARGKILRKEQLTNFPAPAYKEINLSIKDIPAEAAPEATIVVYTVLPSNEIIAESIKVNLPSVFENQLKLAVSKPSGQPGENVVISLDTAGDSLIALRGVDQSVLLLKEDKDITTKTIEDEVKAFQNQVNNHRNWGGSNSYQVFEETGVVIITNGALERPYRYHGGVNVALSYENQAYYTPGLAGVPAPAAAFASTPITGGAPVRHKIGNSAGAEVRIRQNFPETWLWEEVQANASNTNINKVIPDTLTSWYISGYALSPSKGIGVVPKPVVFETFRPFFISLNLPYSVVKGEVFGLQVLVHNYMANEVTAAVTLKNTGEALEFQEEENKNQAESTKSITIGPNEVKSLIFVIKPVKFGTTSLDVKAVTTSSGSEQAGDAISRPLIVRPPGQKQTMNKAILVDLRNTTTSQDTIEISYPPKRVEGADALKVTVISDLLGSTVSNLDKLLKMPSGCGEQNMVYFVPDIVILQYLESSGTLTPAIKNKAIRFLESGYQRQLTYRHDDGSFSAFGKHDAHGSTWLTAFVVRSFVAAKPYITIDDSVIIQALRFLKSKQQSDGSFVEHGTVLQNELKGGAVESLSLSSYVSLAFVESSKIFDNVAVSNITETTSKGLGYITQAPTGLDNPYAASLITYTLKVAGNEKAEVFKQILESLAKRDGDLKYWEPKKVEKPANATEALSRPWVPRIKPISVEMTSYALLTYLLEGKLEDALPVARWLLQQRNEQGGFISTQDTVVGLTALAKFAMTTKSSSTDLEIRVAQELGVVTFEVNKQNEIVLQERSLPPFVKSVNIIGEGTGTALAQVTWSYYVEDKSEEPAFGLDIKTVSKASKLQLDICSWYTHSKENKTSNMALMEVNLPSGFAFDSDGLTEITSVEGVKRYELEEGDSQLNIYFDSLSATKTCLTLPANRVFKVANPAKPYVQVFDYYDTTLRAREFYESPEFSACEICKDEDSCAIKNCV